MQQNVLPLSAAYNGTAGQNQGFYVIAPPATNYFTDPATKTSTAPTNLPAPTTAPDRQCQPGRRTAQ